MRGGEGDGDWGRGEGREGELGWHGGGEVGDRLTSFLSYSPELNMTEELVSEKQME